MLRTIASAMSSALQLKLPPVQLGSVHCLTRSDVLKRSVGLTVGEQDLLERMQQGMEVKRTTTHSVWYGVADNVRYHISNDLIQKLLRTGRIVFVGKRMLSVKLRDDI